MKADRAAARGKRDGVSMQGDASLLLVHAIQAQSAVQSQNAMQTGLPKAPHDTLMHQQHVFLVAELLKDG